MRALLLAVASLAIAMPAAAKDKDHGGSKFEISLGSPSAVNDIRFGSRSGDRRDSRRHGGDIFLGDWEYTGNQVFRSDSYNDWWHDRPDRAYPRWMRNNANCERKWWGGDTLRC